MTFHVNHLHWQMIHIKCQALFSHKNNNNKKYLKMLSAAILNGAFKIKETNENIQDKEITAE